MSTIKQKEVARDIELRILSNYNGFCRSSKNLGVYILESGGYYKIGYTTDLMRRIEGLSTGNPLGDVKIIFWILTTEAKTLETTLHDRFQDKRHYREWFRLDEEDLKDVVEFISEWWIKDN